MTGPALTAEQAESLARGIRGGRLAVAAVYNEIAARAGTGLPDFKTVVLGIDDPVAAYKAAIQTAAAATPPFHKAFLAGMSALGMIDLDTAMAEGSTAASPITILPQNLDGTVVEAQAFTAAMAGTLGVADLLNAFSLAARRLCLIRAKGKQGTGFLIGPHTVLTNWHVMSDLIDPATGKAMDGSAREISCRFETLTDAVGRLYPAADDWLIGLSPMLKDAADPLPQAHSPDGTFLDYCAIRLQGAPGRERGWYDLSQTGALDHATDSFFVFQHPAAVPQRAGFASNTVVDADPAFLRHQVWTASGSSGGLCLDNQLRPIALHHAAVRHATETEANGQPKLLYNRAIRLSAIHAARGDLGSADPLYDRTFRLSDGSQAVIGRASTQATLRLMAAGKAPPILVIRGARLSGKSFTTALLRDSIPIDSRKIIMMSADELPAEAGDLARHIMGRAGMNDAEIDAALKPQASLTTATATVADIFKILKSALLRIAAANPVQPFTLWLVIDQLDLVPMPGIGARTLLDQMYSDAELRKVLRVVLIGLTGTLTSVDPTHISTEQLSDPRRLQDPEIEECLAGLMIAAGLVPAAGEASRHANLILGATDALDAQSGQSTPLAVLSGLLSSVYMKAVEAWKPR